MKTLFFIASLCLFASCGISYEDAAWQVAEHSKQNRDELLRFLEYYQLSGETEKYQAACFLVANK